MSVLHFMENLRTVNCLYIWVCCGLDFKCPPWLPTWSAAVVLLGSKSQWKEVRWLERTPEGDTGTWAPLLSLFLLLSACQEVSNSFTKHFCQRHCASTCPKWEPADHGFWAPLNSQPEKISLFISCLSQAFIIATESWNI